MEYKFRGKRKDNGEWVYGYLFKTWDECYILWGATNNIPNMIEVIPETIGQYTGLKDKNGKEIYSGDIVKKYYYEYDENFEEVEKYNIEKIKFDTEICCFYISIFDNLEVIGNTTDNPELLKEDK